MTIEPHSKPTKILLPPYRDDFARNLGFESRLELDKASILIFDELGQKEQETEYRILHFIAKSPAENRWRKPYLVWNTAEMWANRACWYSNPYEAAIDQYCRYYEKLMREGQEPLHVGINKLAKLYRMRGIPLRFNIGYPGYKPEPGGIGWEWLLISTYDDGTFKGEELIANPLLLFPAELENVARSYLE